MTTKREAYEEIVMRLRQEIVPIRQGIAQLRRDFPGEVQQIAEAQKDIDAIERMIRAGAFSREGLQRMIDSATKSIADESLGTFVRETLDRERDFARQLLAVLEADEKRR